jgi:antibiotic biosynthesis monooxygenase (ABM) superfamily enzyme
MKRREYITAMLAGIAGAKVIPAQTAAATNPIVLYCDLTVTPAREKEMLDNFHDIFKPEAVKFPGYIDVKLLKLRAALSGAAPAGINYRFQLTFQSEEARQKWIHSDIHKRVWPTVENTLATKNYSTLLFDSM